MAAVSAAVMVMVEEVVVVGVVEGEAVAVVEVVVVEAVSTNIPNFVYSDIEAHTYHCRHLSVDMVPNIG